MSKQRLRFEHVEKRTWDPGNPEAVDGYVTWCNGCGQRPWPCDTEVVMADRDRLWVALQIIAADDTAAPSAVAIRRREIARLALRQPAEPSDV